MPNSNKPNETETILMNRMKQSINHDSYKREFKRTSDYVLVVSKPTSIDRFENKK